MILRKRNILLNVTFIICLLLISSISVHAFGISLPYYENDEIPLEIDQTLEYVVVVQNGEDTGFPIEFNYTVDGNVAKLRERDLFIPAKSYDNDFVFDVKLPNTSLPGDVYELEFWAKPILEGQGQIALTFQVKRSVKFITVEEGGVGVSTVKLSWFQKVIYSLWGLIEKIYLYLIIIALVALIYIYFNRILLVSKSIVKSLLKRRKVSGFKADDLISKAKNIGDLSALIRLMSDKDFDSFRIRQLLSNKFENLGKKKLSAKVMSAKSKSEILRSLKKK